MIEYTEALTKRTLKAFKNSYADIDVLLVDDIEALSGKEAIQEAFGKLADQLIGEGKPLIVTAKCPPYQLKNMNTALIEKLTSGAIVSIKLPDAQMLKKILCNRIDLDMGDDVPANVKEEVIDLLAGKYNWSLDQMVIAIKRMASIGELMEEKITLELAEKVVEGTTK